MYLSRIVRLLFFIAAGEGSLALGFAAFGRPQTAAGIGIVAGSVAIVAILIDLIQDQHERKTNGRYRKAPEAHRAGAGGSAGDSASGGASGGPIGAGAVMSGLTYLPRASQLPHLHVGQLRIVGPDGKPTPRPAGEFDGKQADFAAGVVTGTRSFNVDKLGRLLGVAFATVWTPGENEAKCMERVSIDQIMYGYAAPNAVHVAQRPPHSIAECSHGFYGYYEGSNDYYEAGRVMGVVEAYGETVIGSRGFRASKARIVALHIPSEISAGRRRLVTRNYPDVAIFDSFDAMVSEFPPDDAGHGLNPDTDPNFWTRKA